MQRTPPPPPPLPLLHFLSTSYSVTPPAPSFPFLSPASPPSPPPTDDQYTLSCMSSCCGADTVVILSQRIRRGRNFAGTWTDFINLARQSWCPGENRLCCVTRPGKNCSPRALFGFLRERYGRKCTVWRCEGLLGKWWRLKGVRGG